MDRCSAQPQCQFHDPANMPLYQPESGPIESGRMPTDQPEVRSIESVQVPLGQSEVPATKSAKVPSNPELRQAIESATNPWWPWPYNHYPSQPTNLPLYIYGSQYVVPEDPQSGPVGYRSIEPVDEIIKPAAYVFSEPPDSVPSSPHYQHAEAGKWPAYHQLSPRPKTPDFVKMDRLTVQRGLEEVTKVRDTNSPIWINGTQYTVKQYARVVPVHTVYMVCLDDSQQLPFPQKFVVKLYVENEDQGPAQMRLDTERRAYQVVTEHGWRHTLKFYGEVKWKPPFDGEEYPGLAMEYCEGEALSKELVAKMSSEDRGKLCNRVYRLMNRMAKVGFCIGDSNLDHVRVEWRKGRMIVKVLDFDQYFKCKPYIARITNSNEMTGTFHRCDLNKE